MSSVSNKRKQICYRYKLSIAASDVDFGGIDMASFAGNTEDVEKESIFDIDTIKGGPEQDFALGFTLKPGGVLVTDIAVDLSEVVLNNFKFSLDGGWQIKTLTTDKAFATIQSGLIKGKIEYDEATGKMQYITINAFNINKLTAYGLSVVREETDDRKRMEFVLPEDALASIVNIRSSNLFIRFPIDDSGKLIATGQMNKKGEILEDGTFSSGAVSIGMREETDAAIGSGKLIPAFKAMVMGVDGNVGAKAEKIAFTTRTGETMTFNFENPQLLGGESLKFGEDMEDGMEKMRLGLDISTFRSENPIFKGGSISVMVSPEKDEELVIKVENPTLNIQNFDFSARKFENLRLKLEAEYAHLLDEKVLAEWYQEYSEAFPEKPMTLEEFTEWRYKDLVGNSVSKRGEFLPLEEYRLEGNLSGTVKGTLYAWKNTEKKEWTIGINNPLESASAEGAGASLDLSGTKLTFRKSILGHGSKRKDKEKEERKELSFDYLDKAAGSLVFVFFGQKVKIKVLPGGYVDFLSAVNGLYRILMKQINQSDIRKNLRVFENKIIDIIENADDFVVSMVRTFSDYKSLVRTPYQTFSNLRYRTRVKGGMFQLVSYYQGEEQMSVDLAIASPENLNSSKNLVKLSALLEWQLNEYPEPDKKEGSGLIYNTFVEPFMSKSSQIIKSRSPAVWADFADNYESLSSSELRAEIDRVYEENFTFWQSFTGSFSRTIASKVIPWSMVKIVEIMRSGNLQMQLTGSYAVSDTDKALGNFTMSLTDRLEPVIRTQMSIPGFSQDVKGSTFSTVGIEVGDAQVKFPGADGKTIELQIFDGKIENPGAVFPAGAEKKEEEKK